MTTSPNIWTGFAKPTSGHFWYGSTTNFPGFNYKANAAGGVRKSTKFAPGGSSLCNHNTYLYNKYKPGFSGVGANSTSVRRAKNRLSSVCTKNESCGQFYTYLGRYNNYTSNQNGFFPYPPSQYTGKIISKFNSPATVSMYGVLKHQ
jgi:hypothetical protein